MVKKVQPASPTRSAIVNPNSPSTKADNFSNAKTRTNPPGRQKKKR